MLLCREHLIADLAVIVCVAFDHRASADGLRKFKDCIERCPFVDTALEVSGTYDFIVQGRCASFAEYNQQMERIRPHIAEFAARFEPNFIIKTTERRLPEDQTDSLWLPCEGGHRHVKASMIDKVEALHASLCGRLELPRAHDHASFIGPASEVRLHSTASVVFGSNRLYRAARPNRRLLDGQVVRRLANERGKERGSAGTEIDDDTVGLRPRSRAY